MLTKLERAAELKIIIRYLEGMIDTLESARISDSSLEYLKIDLELQKANLARLNVTIGQ